MNSQMQNIPYKNQEKIRSTNQNSSKNFFESNAQTSKMASPPINVNKKEKIPENENNQGFFSNLWNKIKSSWTIEEEDYIDAHGFPAKRPKKKIPLLNKKEALNRDANYEGGTVITYASQHSPFGRLFL